LIVYQAINAFPNLDNYSKFWPVNDMIMMHLKYMSGHARQKEVGMAAGKNKKHTFKVSPPNSTKVHTNTSIENLIIVP
ncbi:hypothetical protein P692DRAFT_20748571, partial [Suillus brevipes Sb2]